MQSEGRFPRLLKICAERAELDEDDGLHKFRATFTTRCLWAGVDPRTVQQWLGHSDMVSPMPYLKPSPNENVREKVNEIVARVAPLLPCCRRRPITIHVDRKVKQCSFFTI